MISRRKFDFFILPRLVTIFLLIFLCQYGKSLVQQTTEEEQESSTTRAGNFFGSKTSVSTFDLVCDALKRDSGPALKSDLFFQCLPYITGNSRGKDVFFSQASILLTLEAPPAPGDGKTLIKVDQLTMPTFHVLGNSDFRPDIELEAKISWQDDRLKWDPSEWHVKTYPVDLKPAANFWGPRFSSKPNSRVNALFETLTYQKSTLSYTGAVNATLTGQLVFSDCKMDVTAYPYDYINCCMDFVMSPSDNKAKLDENSQIEMIWDTDEGGIWKVRSMDFKATKFSSGSDALDGARLCVSARRNTAALGVELSLPMGVSAVVMMLAQFAGKWHMQIYVKMFALFLQLFAFQTLVPNEALNVATKMPKIFAFYNFTVIMTLISLVQTMICWALSRRWMSAPPPHRYKRWLNSAGRCLLGDSKQQRSSAPDDGQTMGAVLENGGGGGVNGNVARPATANTAGAKPGDFRDEWEGLFTAVHALLSILIIVCYVIGVLIIVA